MGSMSRNYPDILQFCSKEMSSKLNASSLQGLKIRDRCFLISISDGAIRSVLVTL